MMKTFMWVVLVVAAAYWAAISYPDLVFKHSVEYKGFVFRSQQPLVKPVDNYVDTVASLLEAFPLYSQSRKFTVYLCGPGFLYTFYTPFCGDDRGCSYSMVGDRIFLPVAEPADAGVPVLVRQALYDLVQEKYTPLKYHFLKEWKMTGYAESLGGESRGYASSAVCGNDNVPEDFRLLLEKRLAVEIMMSDEKINFMALLNGNYSYEHVKARTMLRHCGK